MKSVRYFLILLALSCSSVSVAQTAIDKLQKNNLTFLELQEANGFNFRSQIITEFNKENASQKVNLKLNNGFIYEFVAMADENVEKLELTVKNSKSSDWIEVEEYQEDDRNTVYIFKPVKTGKYSFTINVNEFNTEGKGFVSFMVLRKSR